MYAKVEVIKPRLRHCPNIRRATYFLAETSPKNRKNPPANLIHGIKTEWAGLMKTTHEVDIPNGFYISKYEVTC